MPIESILDAPRAGLTYERLRLDAASRNVAGANVPIAPGQSATQLRVDGAAGDFARLLNGEVQTTPQQAAAREVYDPGHPMADAKGMVHYPATDMVQEMTTLMTASRSYEANVRSFNLLRGMMLHALEIGAK
jgi:flagellar basal-body rod protein FlgC